MKVALNWSFKKRSKLSQDAEWSCLYYTSSVTKIVNYDSLVKSVDVIYQSLKGAGGQIYRLLSRPPPPTSFL